MPFDKDLVENTKVKGQEAALFWYGVIWRLSATKQHGVSLNSDFEEKLRRMVLSEDTSNGDIYYALHYCKGYRKDNPTFAMFDCKGNVAMLIVDEFQIVLFNGEEATQSNEVIWGMNFKCDVRKLNNGSRPDRIGLFPTHIFWRINTLVLHLLVKRIDFKGKFNAFHQKLFGRDMPDFFFKEVMNEVRKAKLADMYTVPNYVLAMKRVIHAHPEMYKVRFVEE